VAVHLLMFSANFALMSLQFGVRSRGVYVVGVSGGKLRAANRRADTTAA
jgi:hypothetical protein